MLRIIAKCLLTRTRPPPPQISRLFASFQNRDFVHESTDDQVNSLQARFARNVAIRKNPRSNEVQYTVRYADFFPVANPKQFTAALGELDSDQLPRLVVFASIFRSRTQVSDYTFTVNVVDDECARRVPDLDSRQMLELMDAYMFLVPAKIAQLEFYRAGIERLAREFQPEQGLDDFIKICFYLGLWKKNRTASNLVRNLLDANLETFLAGLNTTELAIVASAAFKTSVQVQNEEFRSRLLRAVLEMDEKSLDMQLLVTFVKSLRHNKVKDEQIIEKIRELVKGGALEEANFTSLAHLFTYVAECLCNDIDLVKFFVRQCKSLLSMECRTKDLAAFLWSVSHINVEVRRLLDVNELGSLISHKFNEEEYKYTPDILTDTVLSLWTLNLRSDELLAAALANRPMKQGVSRDRIRLDSREILLVTCAEVESPTVFARIAEEKRRQSGFKENREADQRLLVRREQLKMAKEMIEGAEERLKVQQASFVVPFAELNIAGILVELESGERIHVEVLDSSNRLSDRQTPIGLFQLKMRLLEKAGCKWILLDSETLDEASLIEAFEKVSMSEEEEKAKN